MEKKKTKSMEIIASKVKSRILPVLTSADRLSYKSSFDVKSMFLDSWLEDLLADQISTEIKFIWERYEGKERKGECADS
jgi:hypothetical protein